MKRENNVCIFEVKCPFCKKECFCMGTDSYFWDNNFVKVECANNSKHRFVVFKKNGKYIAKIISRPNIEKQYPEAYRLARRFHEFYEQSAPAFGYETKKETKEFDPESSNGRLMAWVCYEIVKEEKQELIKKIRNKFLRTSTIGRHTLDVFDDYVNGMDLFDNNF